MNTSNTLGPSKLGLAVQQPELERHLDWLCEQGRDIELQDLCEQHDLLDGDWQTLARQQAKLLSQHKGRVGVHAPYMNMQLAAADSRVRKVVQERYLQGLDFAAEVGGQWLVVHSPFHFWGGLTTAHRATLAGEIALAQYTLEPVLEQAIKQGVTIVIENIADRDITPLLKLVQSFDCEYVRLSVDVGHAHIGAALGGLSAQGWLTQAGKWLGHVHIQDNDGLSDEHLAPEKGTIHWPAVWTALEQSEAFCVVEVMPHEVDAAVQWLQAHTGELK